MTSTSSSICLRETPYGGRGIFATGSIPKNTLLLSCDAPYATVIFRKFRKEVCGQCFSYAFDAHRNAWNIKYDGQESNGVWFCSEECCSIWVQEQNLGGLLGLMNLAVDKLAKGFKKPKGPPLPSFVDHLLPEEITLEVHDQAWKNAEDIYARPGSQVPCLDEMELDTVRFVLSAIVRRHFEDTSSAPGALNWLGLLQLQNNEILHVRSRPYMLDSHIRIYGFLRKVLLPVLQLYVKTSDMVRAILGRDQGNVFGLWDMSTKGDSEMLGWSMYLSGSYFNHSCAPNVRKDRKNRALGFHTTRDINAGEELCISYIDTTDYVLERQDQLSKNWYFDCACERCGQELATINGGISLTPF